MLTVGQLAAGLHLPSDICDLLHFQLSFVDSYIKTSL